MIIISKERGLSLRTHKNFLKNILANVIFQQYFFKLFKKTEINLKKQSLVFIFFKKI